jgi:trimeric autotransporter adhesin
MDATKNQQLKMSKVVPVTGLIFGRFHRLENEMSTVLEMWGGATLARKETTMSRTLADYQKLQEFVGRSQKESESSHRDGAEAEELGDAAAGKEHGEVASTTSDEHESSSSLPVTAAGAAAGEHVDEVAAHDDAAPCASQPSDDVADRSTSCEGAADLGAGEQVVGDGVAVPLAAAQDALDEESAEEDSDGVYDTDSDDEELLARAQATAEAEARAAQEAELQREAEQRALSDTADAEQWTHSVDEEEACSPASTSCDSTASAVDARESAHSVADASTSSEQMQLTGDEITPMTSPSATPVASPDATPREGGATLATADGGSASDSGASVSSSAVPELTMKRLERVRANTAQDSSTADSAGTQAGSAWLSSPDLPTSVADPVSPKTHSSRRRTMLGGLGLKKGKKDKEKKKKK